MEAEAEAEAEGEALASIRAAKRMREEKGNDVAGRRARVVVSDDEDA